MVNVSKPKGPAEAAKLMTAAVPTKDTKKKDNNKPMDWRAMLELKEKMTSAETKEDMQTKRVKKCELIAEIPLHSATCQRGHTLNQTTRCDAPYEFGFFCDGK